ncbi:9191_t:CDS:2, partial [Cetraspora pellucida]
KHTEKVLFEVLQKIVTEKDVLAEKTMSLLSIFDEHMCSFSIQWDSVCLKDERKKTSTEQEKEIQIRKENELELRSQQKNLRNYSLNCSEDDTDTHVFPVELEPNNLELESKCLYDAAELGFNLDEEFEQHVETLYFSIGYFLNVDKEFSSVNFAPRKTMATEIASLKSNKHNITSLQEHKKDVRVASQSCPRSNARRTDYDFKLKGYGYYKSTVNRTNETVCSIHNINLLSKEKDTQVLGQKSNSKGKSHELSLLEISPELIISYVPQLVDVLIDKLRMSYTQLDIQLTDVSFIKFKQEAGQRLLKIPQKFHK